ncbi:MAG TPA: Ig-like domain repeat protein [Pyrinomonadaceae bacterium]|jgi:hypothetical protein|nr:Ig-like domain repeat protein [Pyrinomonadaceae bacterium]
MRHNLITILCLLLLVATARAQSGPQLTQAVGAGGGGTSASGQSQAEGTVGQNITGTSTGGSFQLESGFWAGAAAQAQAHLSVDNVTAVYGGTINLKATLSATGANVSGKPVTFSLNGTNLGTATTDANGLAVFNNVSLGGVNAGTYATGISAGFAGDIGLTASSGVGQLVITKAVPLLVVVGGSFVYDGQPHAATASATGVNNEALGPISLLYNGAVNIPVNAGSYAVTATFAGGQNYNPVTNNQKGIVIGKANQAITFAALSNKIFGDANFTVSATASSGLAVSFAASGNCTVSGTSVHLTGAGPCTIKASQAGNSNFNAAADVSRTFIINKADQHITFGAIANRTFGNADFTVSATTDVAGLSVTFSASGQCSVSGAGLVHIKGAGSCTITASQAGDNNHNAAASVSQSFSIAKATTTVSLSSSVTPSDLGQSVTFTATVSSAAGMPTGTAQFKIDGSNAGAPVALNASGVATFNTTALAAGSHTLAVNYGGDGNFNVSTATLAGGQVVNSQPSLSIDDVSVTEGNSGGTTAAVFTVSLSTASSLTVKVNYSASNGTATSVADYQATSGTLVFNPGELTRTITVPIKGDTANEPDEVFTIRLTNPHNSSLARAQATGTILNDDATGFQFSASSYSVDEDGLHAIVTVNRAGDLSAPASVDYTTSDDFGLTPCNVTNGLASQRCDNAMAVGTLRFAAGESTRTIFVPVVDDVYVEGPETFHITLINPAGGSQGSISTATITIIDDDNAVGVPNPIDRADFFVREHYIDFLDREPEPTGLQGWLDILNGCGTTVAEPCDRIHISSNFFRSDEFQMRGYYIYRFYRTLGRNPRYAEFMPDSARVSGFLTQSELEANKTAFVQEFMSRQEFKNRYDSTVNNPAAYVDELLQAVGLPDHSSRGAWIAGLTNHTLTRAKVLRALVESTDVYRKFYNAAFVVEMYFGYLRRDPDILYLQWIKTLNQTDDYRTLINGFLNSQEYRQRFGP